jgi:hypothetical protein
MGEKYMMLFLWPLAVALGLLVVGTGCSARTEDSAAPCEVRLRVIDGCKQQWGIANHKTANDVPNWDDIRPFLPSDWTNRFWADGRPICPEGGSYTLGRIGEPPRCSTGGPRHSVPNGSY